MYESIPMGYLYEVIERASRNVFRHQVEPLVFVQDSNKPQHVGMRQRPQHRYLIDDINA